MEEKETSQLKNSQVKRQYTGQITRPRKSILRRWAVTNATFFFVAFAFFALMIFFITSSSFIGSEKSNMVRSMDTVAAELKTSNRPLTADNLSNYFNYNMEKTGSTIEMSHLVTSMIGSKNQFFIYDVNKELIFSTAGDNFPFYENTHGVVRTVKAGNYTGYLESRPVISQTTGQVTGYMQSFYNLADYHKMQERLILSLIGVMVLAMVAAIIFGYTMADHFLRPLKKLSDSMETVAANPEEIFEPVILREDDEIKQIGDFYNEMMSRIATNVDQQKRFVSDVAHELRTPLAVIDGNLNMLQRWGFDDRELVEENVTIAADEAKRMNAMLKDMLDLSRLEALSDEARDATSDVAHVSQNVVRNFQNLHEDFDIQFSSALTGDALARISDNHYAQLLTILIENGIKYSSADRKSIRTGLSMDDDFIITRVADSGVGISKQDAEHVFERFFRADKARNREIGGTGLGLSILSNILKLYQGEITLDSELDVGTTFTFKIPRVK